MHVVITDSGLGGLSICAAVERRVRESPPAIPVRLTYVNVWPEEGRGYNDFPDMPARSAVFDRALARITALAPDRILIACNTLSIVYALTEFSKAPACPVQGIVDAGVDLFTEALGGNPSASIVLLGTRTTIESGAHRSRLVERGVDAARVAGVSCHGLATAIERDMDGPGVGTLLEECADGVSAAAPAGATVFAGLCCTHYGYVAARIAERLALALGRPVRALDPNARMVQDLEWPGASPPSAGTASGGVTVEVVSKVRLDERTRSGMARLAGVVSPATAHALLSYRHVPDLF